MLATERSSSGPARSRPSDPDVRTRRGELERIAADPDVRFGLKDVERQRDAIARARRKVGRD